MARNDVEMAFGVLQSKWHILSRPGRYWSKAFMGKVVKCCIILHNMAVENREADEGRAFESQELAEVVVGGTATPMWGNIERLGEHIPFPPGTLAALCELRHFTVKKK